jgi:biotin carboxylase
VGSSLGDPAHFGATINKNLTQRAAAELGLRTPAQCTVATWADAAQFFTEQRGRPVVLKHPLSWAGIDVRLCRTRRQLRAAFEALHGQPPLGLLEGGRAGSRKAPPDPVSTGERGLLRLERFIEGTPASYVLAAWRGELLAGYPLLKEQIAPPLTGTASVVRAIQHREITATAKALTAHFKLTGFAEFDFMLERGTGRAFLLECNARPSMLSVLGPRIGVDLCRALAARLRGQPLPPTRLRTGTRVALFPQEWRRDATNPILHTPAHDVPWDDPQLVKAAV